MPSTRSSRQRQSRLTFTPLPSSSPAAKGYPKQFQERAAAVTYDMSPAKRRRIHNTAEDEEDDLANVMPTPQPTTSRRKGSENSDSGSEPVRSTQRRPSTRHSTDSKRRAKQARINFDGHTESSAPSTSLRESSPSGPSSSHGMFRTAKQRPRVKLSSEESEEEDELPSPGKLLRQTRSRTSKVAIREPQSNTSHDRRNRRRSSQRAVVIESDNDEQEEHDVAVRPSSPPQLDGHDSSDDEMPTTQGKQTRARRRTGKRTEDDFINDELDSEPDESEEDVEVVGASKKNGQQMRRESWTGDEDDDEDDLPITPKRRKLKQLRQLTQQEQEDIDEDLDFLGPSSDVEASGRQPRNTQSTQKEARLQALERLKRRRSGNVQQQVMEEADDHHDEVEDPYGDEPTDDEDDDEVEEIPPPATTREMFEADEYDESFLTDEDENNDLGVPSNVPLQFTRYASMKAKELFKFAIEWMVQKKINPAFARDDEIYELTFKKLDDEIQGLVGSKFISSVWTADFTKALQGRPESNFTPLDRGFSSDYGIPEKCDACNRTDRHATWEVAFTGKPYNRSTLDPVGKSYDDDDSESSSSEDEDDPAYDAQGRQLPPHNKIFLVGKFCKANAETAHALYHWRLHLYDWVEMWLIDRGYDRVEEIVKRDKMTERKRRKHANKIVDRMEEEHVIKELWKSFNQKIHDARESKQGRY